MEQNSKTPLIAESASPERTRTRHYHIHWSGSDTLDWERFETRSAAEDSARQLVRPGENYTIKEQGETCPRCISIRGIDAAATVRLS